MTTPQPSPSKTVAERIASIDVLRGLTMLLMLWVNDIGDGEQGTSRTCRSGCCTCPGRSTA